MRGARSTLVLFVAFVAVASYAYFVETERPTREEAENTRARVFSIESSDVTELRVTATSGDETHLRRTDDGWRLVEPVEADADEAEVSGITSGLAALELERVLDETASDLEPFGLADPRIEIAFKTSNDTDFIRLLIGDETATGGDMYAALGATTRVFLIAAYQETSLDRTTFDLRDKSILRFDRDAVDRLTTSTVTHTVELTKAGDVWRISRPWEARGDSSMIDGLVGRLRTAQMQSIASSDAADLESYGLAEPRITATLGLGSASTSLHIGNETDDGSVYARDLARPLVFTVDTSLVDELMKTPSEYRSTDLFGFRSVNASRIEIARDEQTIVYEKPGDPDANDERLWRQVSPDAAEVDQAQLSSLLSRLSDLRADRFIESREGAGLDTPILTVIVRFGEDDEQERVVFGRAGDQVYAAVEDDFGAAEVSTGEFETAIDLLDELVDP